MLGMRWLLQDILGLSCKKYKYYIAHHIYSIKQSNRTIYFKNINMNNTTASTKNE